MKFDDSIRFRTYVDAGAAGRYRVSDIYTCAADSTLRLKTETRLRACSGLANLSNAERNRLAHALNGNTSRSPARDHVASSSALPLPGLRGGAPKRRRGLPAAAPLGTRRRVETDAPADVGDHPDAPPLRHAPHSRNSDVRFIFEADPSAIDYSRCLARVWNEGHPRQCSRAPKADQTFCAAHLKSMKHGSVEGELPLAVETELLKFHQRQPRLKKNSY